MKGPSRARLTAPPLVIDDLPATLVEALERAERSKRAESRGLRFVNRRGEDLFVSWTEVIARARRTAQWLQAAGVKRGDRVALVFGTCPEFFDGLFGVQLAGAVPTPLYPPVRLGKMDEYDRRTSKMLDAAGVSLVLTEGRIARLLGGVRRGCQPPLEILTLAQLRARAEDLLTGVQGGRDTKAACEIGRGDSGQPSPGDLALVQFSSGTTVQPKPVALSHAALLHQGAMLAGQWPDTSEQEQAGMSWLPLYHDMGLIGCVVPAILRVANLWLLPPELFVARPALWLETLSRTRASVSPAPNFAYSLCVERVSDQDLERLDLSAWRAALNGAEAVSMDTVRAFEQRFSAAGFRPEAMTPVYGLAEAALAVTFSDLERPPESRLFLAEGLTRGRALEAEGEAANTLRTIELASVGQPVPGFSVEVRDPSGEVLPEGAEGEVFTAGPSLLTAYLGCDRATKEALDGDWLATGDLGFVVEGELFLTGRKKDVLVLRGRNWSPVPIEGLVSEVEGVRTGCVVAVSGLLPNARDGKQPSGGHTEQLWVIAETRLGEDSLDELEQACRAAVRTGLGLEIGRLDLLEPGEIPRTSSGKLRRAATKALADAGRLQAIGSAGLLERLKRKPAVAAGLALLHSRRKDAADAGE